MRTQPDHHDLQALAMAAVTLRRNNPWEYCARRLMLAEVMGLPETEVDRRIEALEATLRDHGIYP